MRRNIIIADKALTMASNAFTPILYRQIFKKDFLREITGFQSLRGKAAKDYTEDDIEVFTSRADAFSRIAFVMTKQAEIEKAADLVKLTTADYFDWISDFENGVFNDATVLSSILSLWQGNAEDSHVDAKN